MDSVHKLPTDPVNKNNGLEICSHLDPENPTALMFQDVEINWAWFLNIVRNKAKRNDWFQPTYFTQQKVVPPHIRKLGFNTFTTICAINEMTACGMLVYDKSTQLYRGVPSFLNQLHTVGEKFPQNKPIHKHPIQNNVKAPRIVKVLDRKDEDSQVQVISRC
jgi:hypothetical protein